MVRAGSEKTGTGIYDPLKECSGLFRTFSELAPDEDSVLDFANKYGLLSFGSSVVPKEKVPQNVKGWEWVEWAEEAEIKYAVQGERLVFWADQIKSLRNAIDLWDELTAGERGIVKLRAGPALSKEENEDAWHRLAEIAGAGLGSTGGAKLSYDGEQIGFRLHFHASGLQKALWMQFASAIVGKKRFETCKQCSNYFEIGPSAGRMGKVYCSDACRTAAYRERKAEQT